MRVAHFVQRYPPALGGSEAYFARLSEFLAAEGDQVHRLHDQRPRSRRLLVDAGPASSARPHLGGGVEVRRYPLWRCPGQRRGLQLLSGLHPPPSWQRLDAVVQSHLPGACRSTRSAARSTFDLVHAAAFPYGWSSNRPGGSRASGRCPSWSRPSCTWATHSTPGTAIRAIYLAPALLALLAAADRVFVQTEVERAALLERGLPAEKLVLQGMGVDLQDCTGGDRRQARAQWGVSEEEIVIGHLANLSPEKGSVDLLGAADHARQKGLPFSPGAGRAGDAELPQLLATVLEDIPRSCALASSIDQHKRDFFAGIDGFALPSRSDSFGLVLLEAWANGVPNVAYRAGGIAGVIRDGEDGLLVRCGDRRALAEALELLVSDSMLRRRLGEAGQRRLATEFRWEDKLQLVRRVYRELIHG